MDWLRFAAILALAVIAIGTGGTIVRVVVAAGDLQAAATLGLVAVFLVSAVVAGARDRRWRSNPYW